MQWNTLVASVPRFRPSLLRAERTRWRKRLARYLLRERGHISRSCGSGVPLRWSGHRGRLSLYRVGAYATVATLRGTARDEGPKARGRSPSPAPRLPHSATASYPIGKAVPLLHG